MILLQRQAGSITYQILLYSDLTFDFSVLGSAEDVELTAFPNEEGVVERNIEFIAEGGSPADGAVDVYVAFEMERIYDYKIQGELPVREEDSLRIVY